MVSGFLSLQNLALPTFVCGNMQDTAYSADVGEQVLSPLGLRNASAMAEIARNDRSSLSKARALFPRGMKQISHCIDGLRDFLAINEERIIKNVTISKASAWRIGLVRLGPAVTIPLHDHPNAYSVTYVLAGRVTIDGFSIKSRSCGTVRLDRTWTVDLGPEESAVLDPWDVNVHRIYSRRNGALLFTGSFSNGARLESRRWLFTTNHNEKGTMSAVAIGQDAVHKITRLSGVDFG